MTVGRTIGRLAVADRLVRQLIRPVTAIWPAIWFAALPVGLLWSVVFGGRVLFWGTPLLQFWGWRELVRESYLAGRVPLWNPYLGAGAPLAANVQSAAFYPINLFFFPFPAPEALGYVTTLHLALAGGFTYLLGRHACQLGRPAAALAGTAFALSSAVVARLGFLSMTQAVAWLPLLLLAADRAIAARRPWRWALTLGPVAVAMPLLAGHAQYWFYGLLLAGLCGLFRLGGVAAAAGSLAGAVHVSLRLALRLGVMVGLGLALAAIQLLPTFDLVGQSVRAGGAEPAFAMAASLWPWQVIALISPDFFGTPADGTYWGPGAFWEFTGWIGTLPLVFAVGAAARVIRPAGPPPDRRPFVLFLFGIAAVSLLLATGSYLPIYPWVFAHVPGFNLFQAPARLLVLTTLALALLAGIGADAFCRRPDCWRAAGRWLAAVGAGVAIAGLAIGALPTEPTSLKPTFAGALGRLGLWLGLSGVLLGCADRSRRLAPALALGLAAIDLLSFGARLNPTIDPALYRTPVALPAGLTSGPTAPRLFTPERVFLDRFFAAHSFRTFGAEAVDTWLPVRASLLPDTAVPLHVPELYNYDPLQRADLRAFWRAVERSGFDRRLLDVANVGVVAWNGAPIAGLVAVPTSAGTFYRNPAPPPRAYVVGQSWSAADLDTALALMQSPDFDPAHVVVLESPTPPLAAAGGHGTAHIVVYEPERVVVDATLDGPGYLVLSDAHDPGWRAIADGQPARLLRANGVFRAVALGPGSHRVEFHYEPASFQFGAIVSGGALLIVGGAGLITIVTGYRRR